MNRNNLILLLNAGSIEGRLKFALMVFLIQKQRPSLFSYSYLRGIKSPLSEEFYEDLRSLEASGLVNVTWKQEGTPKRVYFVKKASDQKLEKEYYRLNFLTEEELLIKVYKEYQLSQYEIGDRIP